LSHREDRLNVYFLLVFVHLLETDGSQYAAETRLGYDPASDDSRCALLLRCFVEDLHGSESNLLGIRFADSARFPKLLDDQYLTIT
jgi:hypothetical protein